LASVGRCAESGENFLAAAHTNPLESLELQRKAAMYLLLGGRIEEGLEALRSSLQGAGLKLPATKSGALWSLLFRQLQLRLRGLRYQRRTMAQVPACDLIRIDTCIWAAASMSEFSPLEVASFGALSLILALRAGEPSRILQALSMEAVNLAMGNGLHGKRLQKILGMIDDLAKSENTPRARAGAVSCKGIVAYFEGRWCDAADLCHQAADLYKNHCSLAAWEMIGVQKHALLATLYAGDVGSLIRQYRTMRREADDHGNAYAVANLGVYVGTYVHLAENDVEGAGELLRRLAKQWPQAQFSFPQFLLVLNHANVEI